MLLTQGNPGCFFSKAFPMVLQSSYQYGSVRIQRGRFGEATAWCFCPDLKSVHQTD